MSRKYYVAYGSNLNKLEMEKRCPDAKIIGVSEILNHTLAFRGEEGEAYLTIEEKGGSLVPVAIWEVSAEDEVALDEYEDYPNLYFKKEIELPIWNTDTEEESVENCFVYIMEENRAKALPTKEYMECCLQGYKDFDFDEGCLNDAFKQVNK